MLYYVFSEDREEFDNNVNAVRAAIACGEFETIEQFDGGHYTAALVQLDKLAEARKMFESFGVSKENLRLDVVEIDEEGYVGDSLFEEDEQRWEELIAEF